MKYTTENIIEYINSLPDEKSELLREEGMANLYRYEEYEGTHVTCFHFPNGYGYSYWGDRDTGTYHGEVYLIKGDQSPIETQDDLMQVQCWLRANEIMNLPQACAEEEEDTIKKLKALLYETLEYIHSEKIYRNAHSGPDQRLDQEADSLMQEIKKQFTQEEEKEAHKTLMEKYA